MCVAQTLCTHAQCNTHHNMNIITCIYMQAGETPLFMACQEGHTEVAQLLLQNGAQPDIQRKVCMYDALIFSVHAHYSIASIVNSAYRGLFPPPPPPPLAWVRG